MLFGLKNTSSCAHAALNLSILLSMSFQVLYELVKQLGGRYNWNTICLHTDCFLSVAIGLHSMTLSRVIGLHSMTLLCLDRGGRI